MRSGRKILLTSLFLVATWVSFASISNATDSAPHFGPWLFTDQIRTGDNPRSFVLLTRTDIYDDRSPFLQIICTVGRGYSIALFVKAKAKVPEIGIAIDNKQNLQWRGEMENVGQFGILSAPISAADVSSLTNAQKELVATSPGLGQSFVFNVSETAKAFRVLKAACDD